MFLSFLGHELTFTQSQIFTAKVLVKLKCLHLQYTKADQVQSTNLGFCFQL